MQKEEFISGKCAYPLLLFKIYPIFMWHLFQVQVSGYFSAFSLYLHSPVSMKSQNSQGFAQKSRIAFCFAE
jgi:hypothetical protein